MSTMNPALGQRGPQRAKDADRQLAITAVFVTFCMHAAVLGPLVVVYGLGGGKSDGPQLSDMTVIEASLAYKKNTESKQPQKERAPKPVTEKPTGVSHEDQRAPVERPDAGVPKTNYEDLAKQFQEQHRDEDEDEGETQKAGGDFNGSEHGFADVSKGDPWVQELTAELYDAWKLPSLEKGTGDAQGCVHLDASGRILDTQVLKKTENANIDRSVQLALRDLQKAREDGQKPVPSHLVSLTTKWTCFVFPVPKEGE
jgi:hypothetical protein